jgi:tetratricopeptide (TPR) repeat protein
MILLFALMLAAVAPAQEVGSAVCAQCHPAIAKRYAATPMARSSGRVSTIGPTVPTGPLTDASTQATIRLKLTKEGALTLNLERELPPLSISRELTYFIGSGRIGRSFLFAQEGGFLYQSPISYYADGDTYRASPGFQRKNNVDLTRAVQPSCLLCHASRLQAVAGTQNQYDAKQPFLEGGISCERCHGPGQRHVAGMKGASRAPRPADRAIVNPAKLQPAHRDSVCAQCHLTGAARVARAATKGRGSYTPGDDLARTVAVFVWDKAKDTGLTVTSHFETLDWSRCKQASGDRMWCGSCHDPHGAPVDVRERCLACHSSAKSCTIALATRRARNNDQCQSCHMPKSEVRDAEHAVYTDHSIPRGRQAPSRATVQSMALKELVPFWRGAPVDSRDLALAYAVTALTDASVRLRAFDLLQAAAAKDPSDLAIAAQLAQFYDRMGQPAEAIPLYERVVAGDPANTAACINLGTLYAQANRLPEAMALWQRALAANPALTQARMNLAVAQIREGHREAGIASLRVALAWDPDNPAVAQMLRQVP